MHYIESENNLVRKESIIDDPLYREVWVAVRRCEVTGHEWLDVYTAKPLVTDTYYAVKNRRIEDPIYDNNHPVQYLTKASLKIVT